MGVLRRFVLLIDSVGTALGEMPLLARCVSSALMVSHGLRRDSELYMLVRGRGALVLRAEALRRVHPDEHSLQGVLSKGLNALDRGRRGPVHSGVYVRDLGLGAVVEKGSDLIYVHDRGRPLPARGFKSVRLVAVAPLRGYGPEDLSELRDLGGEPVRVSVKNVSPDVAFVLVNYEMDRWLRGAR